ncbi:hypothetical protein KJ819_03795 [Patescibacteria group bacterium]|nr:hypothetical protein [Patescibacteria group bacterium]MBU1500482.1 hypothetical protein [Patescibacteria group bacterium]MBU2080720.1 hypothetical protein [Patescibacteria group bacterium]MBU2123825.1 hypothetical protein [Patescibacteria group bacterium]MBU2194884.1 hypothetical protein [Patescibacteria group bacterium]
MNKDHNIEELLKDAGTRVSLRADEKQTHRENLLAFMHAGKKPVRSPYATFFASSARYVTAFALFLIVGGTGVVSASGGATPGDLLYPVKLKVREPVQIALARDTEERAELEVAFAGDRLEEFAAASFKGTLSEETVALIMGSLAERLEKAQEDIDALHDAGETEVAIQSNTDLHSLLSAHKSILGKVGAIYPEAVEDVALLHARLDEALQEAENTAVELEEGVEVTGVDTHTVNTQKQEAETALLALKLRLEGGLALLNEEDKESVAESFIGIQELIDQGVVAEEAEDNSEAFLLYSEAHSQLSVLETLLIADHTLGIDLIDATTTPAR